MNLTQEFYTEVYKKYNLDKFSGYMKDIITSWWVILVCFFVAFLLGFVYMGIVWSCATVLVWVIIVLLFVALWGFFFLLFFYANHYPSTENTHEYLRGTSYGVLGLIVIYVIGVICCFKQILIATAIIRAASRFIMKTP